jgi:predicted AlkP superfamily pyrophosphatase or phosphodiesterase
MESIQPPNLVRLSETGVYAADGMVPVFPSLTFPNHYSMATGLYPDHHGITDNTILDHETGKRFSIHSREAIEDPSWWGGEPIWVTAENAGITTATFYWVGSEAPVKGVQPTYWRRFDAEVPESDRVDQVLDWLDLPPDKRPQLIMFYFDSIDATAHTHGADAPETVEAVLAADRKIGRLLDGLRSRGIEDRVNLIVVSDHGMTDRSQDRVLALDDYIDLEKLEIVTTTPILGVNAVDGDVEDVLKQLQGANRHLSVWRKEDLRERFHYGSNPRIPDIVGLMDEGWTLYQTRSYMEENLDRLRGATHGYDPALESMRALFVARGPLFKVSVEIAPFECLQLYELLANLLQIQPAPNDGDPSVLAPIVK